MQENTKFRIFLKRIECSFIGQIKLHSLCRVEPKAQLVIDKHSDSAYVIEVGESSVIKDYARLCPRSGFIKIGKNCSINTYCVLLGYGGITIGNGVRIASNTTITAFQHGYESASLTIKEQKNRCEGIIIEDDVWIGAGCRILDGVTIRKGSVIGAGSVVTKDTEEYSVSVGVPAKKIKERETH